MIVIYFILIVIYFNVELNSVYEEIESCNMSCMRLLRNEVIKK